MTPSFLIINVALWTPLFPVMVGSTSITGTSRGWRVVGALEGCGVDRWLWLVVVEVFRKEKTDAESTIVSPARCEVGCRWSRR